MNHSFQPDRSQPGAVIFDLFGTLISHFSVKQFFSMIEKICSITALNPKLLSKIWLSSVEDLLHGRWKNTKDHLMFILHQAGVKITDEVLDYSERAQLEATENLFTLRPNTLSVLKSLESKGIILGLISGSSPDVLSIWKQSPLHEYFKNPTFSFEVKYNKPNQAIYEICCNNLGVRPEECLYIGDGSNKELSAAKNYGMTAILLQTSMVDVFDPVREDVQSWKGISISDLSEIKAYAQ